MFYSLLAPLLAALYAVFFFISPRRELMKSLGGELGERLALHPPLPPRPPVWVHAASLGEVKAACKLAPELAAALNAPLLITTSTAAGRAEAARLTPYAVLAPLDWYPLAARFIAAAKPRMLIVVETEIWPATFLAAARAGVPVFLANARISPRTQTLYKLLWPLSRLVFSGVARVLAQSEADARRFRDLPGLADKVEDTGNLKHDQLGLAGAGQKAFDAVKAAGWQSSSIFTAGSTHPQEDPVVIEAWQRAKKAVPGLKLVIAPRHTERMSETESALRSAGVKFFKLSEAPADGADCMAVDCSGLLQAFYSISQVCFVGGTLDRTGGHNLLEPSLFARPVLFGPNYRNARTAGERLIEKRGGFLTETAAQMADRLVELLTDPAGLEAAGKNSAAALSSLKGATAKTLTALKNSRG